MSSRLKQAFVILIGIFPITLLAQSNAPYVSGIDSTRNPITVAVPFLSFAPDSRGSALGDAGVASDPDEYSVHWNNAKLAFLDDDLGFSFNYSPWLATIVDDMSLSYLTFHYKLTRNEALGVTMRYFDLGEIYLTNKEGDPAGTDNPTEAAVDVTYSRKLSENMGVGVTARYIWSNLTGIVQGGPKAGQSVAVDLGFYYKKEIMINGLNSQLSLGAHMSNFGRKITYSSDSNEDFIPGNLRLGSALKMNLDPYNTITVLLDFNKLLVPTPPTYREDASGTLVLDKGKDPNRPLLSGTFGSFNDAPRGFQEELQEIMISGGVEYKYQELFALRGGYFYENVNKGNRKYFTAGVGFKYQVFGIDFSYLIPLQQNHPLAETLRLSFQFSFDTKES